MFARTKVDFVLAMAASLAFLGVLKALKIEGQLAVIKNDCYERLAIGQRHSTKDIYKTSHVTTVFECQLFCTEEKELCKSFSFGIGVKGNASCELSTETIKETADLKPIGTKADTDYDLYIKKLGCTLVIDKNNPAFDHYKPQNKPSDDYKQPHDKPQGGSSYDKPQSDGYGTSNKPSNAYEKPVTSGYEKPSRPSYDKPPSISNKPSNSGYDKPSRPSGGYDSPPLQSKPSYNGYGPPSPTKPTYGSQEDVQHVQTLVSISTGPQKPVLHPYHDILVNEEPYNYARPPFRPSALNHPYDKPYTPGPDDYGPRPQRPDYDRPNPNYDSRPGESSLVSYGHRPIPDKYASYIPRPDHYNDYFKPRPDDFYRPDPPSDYHRPRPPPDDYSSGPRPPLDDYNSRPRPDDYNSKPRPPPDDYNDRPPLRPRPDDYNSKPRPPPDDYNDRPPLRPRPDDYNSKPRPPPDDYNDRPPLRPRPDDYNTKPRPPPDDYNGRPPLRPRPDDYNSKPRPPADDYNDRPRPPSNDYNSRPRPNPNDYNSGSRPPPDDYHIPIFPNDEYPERPHRPDRPLDYDRPNPSNENYNRPKPASGGYDKPNPSSNNDDRPNPSNSNYDRPNPSSNNYDRPNPSSNSYNNRPSLQSDDYKVSKPTNEYLFNEEVDRYDPRPDRPSKPSEGYQKPETIKPNKPTSGYDNAIQGSTKPKDPHNKPIVTQSVGPNGESITSIITELEEEGSTDLDSGFN